MKRFFNIVTALLLVVMATSCLDSNLESLDTYEGNDITGVSGVYHRYYGTDIIPGSGEVKVHQVSLNYGAFKVNKEENSCTFECSLPSNFPAAERPNFRMSNVVVILNISTAAVIKPIEGAPVLGKPGDWSKPNKYEVMAANGEKKIWIVEAVEK